MSTTARQTNLLAAEDWTRVYETFREADFQSYDFETLRKTMIDYLRLYYPEDFNDFIESSEYIALIDLLAFMGQSLAFRTDLNARENFIDTAERRDSIIKLARLVSYFPKRNIAASGLLKFDSVSTTETVYDSDGVNLANTAVYWNDPSNSNWVEQFNTIINAALIDSQVVGKPGNTQTINNVKTEEYAINLTPNVTPVFGFSAAVNDTSMQFEAVSSSSLGQSYIYELSPLANGRFNILRRSDGSGNNSNNTGFFLYFKQGTLGTTTFSLVEAVPNRIVNVNYENINNSDVWLFNTGVSPSEEWKKVPAIAGVNTIYNKSSERNLFQVNSRAADQIDLVFGDGSFTNVPQGTFSLFFRQSNNQSYKISPDEIQGAAITINYVSRSGAVETLTIRASLKYTINNAAARETIDEVRQKAPQQYYTQGRMITGEDYNIVPYTEFSNIYKVKSVNRTSSGISRFLDVIDSSGKYSSTNIFANDGHLYREETLTPLSFTYNSTATVQRIVSEYLQTIISDKPMQHFYYAFLDRETSIGNTFWKMCSVTTNGSTGYFTVGGSDTPIQVGTVTSQPVKHIRVGAIIKFKAASGYYFNTQNQMVPGTPSTTGDKRYLYASVMQVIGDGTNGGAGAFTDGSGPITLNIKVPAQAEIDEIIPVFKNAIDNELMTTISNKVIALETFGLGYNTNTESWYLIEQPFLTDDPYGVIPGSSWLIKISYDTTNGHVIQYRGLDYIFESTIETKFYFDNQVRVFDTKTGTTIYDQIRLLGINSQPDPVKLGEDGGEPIYGLLPLGVDYVWYIYKNIVESDGYENQKKILVTFPDSNEDGIPDNPDLFDIVVAPDTSDKYVFFEEVSTYGGFTELVPLPSNSVVTLYADIASLNAHYSEYTNGQVFYLTSDKVFYVLVETDSGKTITLSNSYQMMTGRSDLAFQYKHNSPDYRRIDPSPNNIIDVFLLTKAYETDFRNWLQDTTGKVAEPIPPSTEDLSLEYSVLNNTKATSDTVIFNSAKYKLLFGDKAEPSLQATFKVVKNPAVIVSDNDIKSNLISAINEYFSIDNWDFGESFYFSELSAYLHTAMSPNVSSVIIVPTNLNAQFGNLYQINAEPNEIMASCATVDNVEIISAITAAQLNASWATT